MAFAEKLIAVRRAYHLTQEQLAARLFVTRQAVSRWERGEVTPGIDMMKLIAAVTGEPLSHLLEMPEYYCQSCGMILTPDDCGTDAAGTATDHYCKWCYDHGKYTYDTTMEAMIEDCAPRLAQNTGMVARRSCLAHGRRAAATGTLARRARKRGALRRRSAGALWR